MLVRNKMPYQIRVFFRKIRNLFKIFFNWKFFLLVYSIFWLNFKRHPFKFEETSNGLIIAGFFYIPLATFFLINHFFRKISRFYSVPLSILGLIALPGIYIFSSPSMNPSSSVEIGFLFFDSIAVPLALASLCCLLGSIPAYFRLIFRKPPYFMFSIFSLLSLVYAFTIELRLYTSYNGYNKFFCSYQDTKKTIAPKVVRVIGSYSEGSGFFVWDNMVITNRHVVEGEDYPKIVLPTGQFLTPTRVELSKDYDIAYLYLDKSEADYKININPAELSSGEEALSFGYALGSDIKGDPTILPIRFENIREKPQDIAKYFQFSSPLVSGMSGGPVVDKCGNFVGINTMTTSGTSLIISARTLTTSYNTPKEEPKKFALKPGVTPKDSVYAYYYLLKARDTKGCYGLLSSNYKTKSTYEEWTARFPNVISVEVFNVEEIKPNLVYVTFGMSEWVNGEQSRKTYEGTWETVKEGDVYHLNKSYIIEFDSYLDLKGPDFFLNPDPKKK